LGESDSRYTETMEKLYTVKETCEILRVSRAKLYLLINDGSLRPVKIDKKTVFKESELQRFMESLNGKSKE
jgi:excisionase family DNA binding protein